MSARSTMPGTAIVWLRRDLRLDDHPALLAALGHEAQLCVYIDDPKREGHWPMGQASYWWLSQSLEALSQSIESLGGELLVYSGNTAEILSQLIEDHQATGLYWNRLYEPAAVAHDKSLKADIKARFEAFGLQVESFQAHVLKEPWQMLKKDQTPYLVFTPYWNHFQATWSAERPKAPPSSLKRPGTKSTLKSLDPKKLSPTHRWTDKLAAHWQPGVVGGKARLDAFVSTQIKDYEETRNRPDQVGTSALSPYLHFGEVSPRQVIQACEPSGEVPSQKGPLSFVREIVWREFSHYLLFYFPHVTDQPLKPVFDGFPWRKREDYQSDLERWKRGQTGVPMVDAGMRQLWATGWMHNRVRMVVASYLTKNLLIPWVEGARYFWDTLVDADLANNSQGWQWTAGSGADASPYFRVFNPVLQGEKFDPQGEYVKHWCPELADRSAKEVHQADPGIDLKAQRQQALDAYAQIKRG